MQYLPTISDGNISRLDTELQSHPTQVPATQNSQREIV